MKLYKNKANKISGIIFTSIGIIALVVFVHLYKNDYIIYSIMVIFFGIFKYYSIEKTQYDLNAGLGEWDEYKQ